MISSKFSKKLAGGLLVLLDPSSVADVALLTRTEWTLAWPGHCFRGKMGQSITNRETIKTSFSVRRRLRPEDQDGPPAPACCSCSPPPLAAVLGGIVWKIILRGAEQHGPTDQHDWYQG